MTGSVERRPFGRTGDGREVTCFTLRGAGGVEMEVLDYGAIVRTMWVPDRQGETADVVLGYDDLASYEADRFFFGIVAGRSANRIRNASFTVDGERHALTANDGPHHLHGGALGFGKALWSARTFEDEQAVGIALEHLSPDGDEGYPGNLAVVATYTLTADNVFAVEYRATTDRPTPVNLTQHSYFNLAGSGHVLDHELTLHASAYTPLDAGHLPTGEIAPVEGTPLDFRRPRPIATGYDNNLVLDGGDGVKPAARLYDRGSGRVMEVYTTEPGMQLYTANFLDAGMMGKRGERYGPCAGACLETQHFPDAPNQPGFPSTLLRPGEEFRSRTEFRFSTR